MQSTLKNLEPTLKDMKSTSPRMAIETKISSPSMKTQSDFNNRHRHPKALPSTVVSYKECRKNHAARLGGLALDGCGEFMPLSPPSDTRAEPGSLNCAACGCHRNFHRQDPCFQAQGPIEIPPFQSPPSSPTPTSFYAPSPHMLIALKNTTTTLDEMFSNRKRPDMDLGHDPVTRRSKRFRTKLKQEQKEKMVLFAEKIGWKLHEVEEKVVEDFCNEVGVERGVLKVWLQNNKHIFRKKEVAAVERVKTHSTNEKFSNASTCDMNAGIHRREHDANGTCR